MYVIKSFISYVTFTKVVSVHIDASCIQIANIQSGKILIKLNVSVDTYLFTRNIPICAKMRK